MLKNKSTKILEDGARLSGLFHHECKGDTYSRGEVRVQLRNCFFGAMEKSFRHSRFGVWTTPKAIKKYFLFLQVEHR